MAFKLLARLFLILVVAHQIHCQCDQATISVSLRSRIGSLSQFTEYLQSGQKTSPFSPTLLLKDQTGLGHYSRVAGGSININGIVKTKISNDGMYLLIFFQTGIRTRAGACIQFKPHKMLIQNERIYNQITRLIEADTGYTVLDSLTCIWNDSGLEESDPPLTLNVAGHRVSLQRVISNNLITSAEGGTDQCNFGLVGTLEL